MKPADRSADLLKLLRRGRETINGLYVVKVITTNPDTLIFEGTQLPLDQDIFEIPKELKPLEEGARYFALPIVAGGGNRWGLLAKLDGKGG